MPSSLEWIGNRPVPAPGNEGFTTGGALLPYPSCNAAVKHDPPACRAHKFLTFYRWVADR